MQSKYFFKTSILFSLLIISSNTFAQDAGLKESVTRGAEIYASECITCHMEDGQGIIGVFPPLAKSDYLMTDTDRAIKVILEGLSGEVVVNGDTYYGEMTSIDFTDREVADIMNYIMNSWGNEGEMVSESDVKKNR